jgi:hypothetical protein
MNPFLSTNTGTNPYTPKPVVGPNPYTPSGMTGPNPYNPVAPTGTANMTPYNPAPISAVKPPLYSNGITSDPVEMAKNRANLATSISNLQPVTPIGINLSNNSNVIDSTNLNTGTTRADVNALVSKKQAELASGTNTDLQPTSGYQKFISDYSNAVQYSPEQQAAYKGQQQTASQIADIQRSLQDRQAKLTQDGSLSPAQVAADMKQYTTEANARIADLQASNRDYTLTFNALENARKNTLDAFQVQSPFYKPQEISPGSQIVDPSTGKVITQGTGISPSMIQSTAQNLETSALQNGTIQYNPDGSVNHQVYLQQAQQQLQSIYGGQIGGGVSTQNMGINQSIQSNINNQPTGSFVASNGSVISPEFATKVAQLPPVLQSYVKGGPMGVAYIDSSEIPKGLEQTAKTATSLGIKVMDHGDVQGLMAMGNLYDVMNQVDSLVSATLGSGVIGKIENSLSALANKYTGYKPILENYNALRETAGKATTALMGGIGSGFRMNMPEIDAAVQRLPTAYDSLEQAAVKTASVRKLLDNGMKQMFPTFQGTGSLQSTGEKTTPTITNAVVQTKAGAINTNW